MQDRKRYFNIVFLCFNSIQSIHTRNMDFRSHARRHTESLFNENDPLARTAPAYLNFNTKANYNPHAKEALLVLKQQIWEGLPRSIVQPLTAIEKSMMLLKILKRFEEQIIVSKRVEEKNKLLSIQASNVILQRVQISLTCKNKSKGLQNQTPPMQQITNTVLKSQGSLKEENAGLKQKIKKIESQQSEKGQSGSELLKQLQQRVGRKKSHLSQLQLKKKAMETGVLNEGVDEIEQLRSDDNSSEMSTSSNRFPSIEMKLESDLKIKLNQNSHRNRRMH